MTPEQMRNIADNYRRMYKARYNKVSQHGDSLIILLRERWSDLPSSEERDDAVLEDMYDGVSTV